MRNLVSSVAIVVLLVALGALTLAAMPRGMDTTATAAAPRVESLASEPAAPAAGPKYNTLALAIDNGVTLASELASDINATTTTTANQVLRWDPTTGYQVYDPTDPFSQDFSLAVGDPVFVLLEGSLDDVYTLVGDVPAQGSVSFSLVGDSGTCKYNFISIPLDKGSLAVASDLATDIGNVSQVLEWNPDAGYNVYDPGDPFSTNFSVRIGYPYYVCMTASKTWPAP